MTKIITENQDRSDFIYDNGYGLTTDIYMLPVGTTFSVSNGAWLGQIIQEFGKKFMLVEYTGRKVELTPDYDYCLSLHNVKLPEIKTYKEIDTKPKGFILHCDNCQTKNDYDVASIPGNYVKITCKSCDNSQTLAISHVSK